MDKRRTPRQRHEEAELLRRTARTPTTPGYFRMRGPGRAHGSSADHAIDTQESFVNLFGVFADGEGWRKLVVVAMMLAPQALACILLVIAISLYRWLA